VCVCVGQNESESEREMYILKVMFERCFKNIVFKTSSN
jgi:hypothetical protein